VNIPGPVLAAVRILRSVTVLFFVVDLLSVTLL
jgi:hypothetical protein